MEEISVTDILPQISKSMVSVLMSDLLKTSLHYIRCLKPNEQKNPGVYEEPMMKSQALYLGLLENLKVREISCDFCLF
jgi:myosin-1